MGSRQRVCEFLDSRSLRLITGAQLPKGKLHVQFTDLRGTALNAKVELGFQRMSGDLGVGGEGMEAFIKMGSETDAIISNLACRGGPGTMYRLWASVPHYRDYSFFQLDSSPSSMGISKTASISVRRSSPLETHCIRHRQVFQCDAASRAGTLTPTSSLRSWWRMQPAVSPPTSISTSLQELNTDWKSSLPDPRVSAELRSDKPLA